jgi:type 1 glutamine amidotransferase
MSKALITWGGWPGHEPDQVAEIFRKMLEAEGIACTVTDSLDCFDDAGALRDLDLIVPVWTMSELTKERAVNVSEAVARGTGIAGCHGGMCDAFRNNVLWQFMTGANWVAHPGGDGVRYRVEMRDRHNPLVDGIPDFDVATEQYYLHVDPANHVLATTRFPPVTWFHSANGPVDMPVAWTRSWGLGRVYYNALGHKANVVASGHAHEMLRRGLLWAAGSKAAAAGSAAKYEDFLSPGNHF